jgi:hypothetical protein
MASARLNIKGIGRESTYIRKNALKIRSIGTKLLGPVVLLTAFTTICNIVSAKHIPASLAVKILKIY